MGDYLHTTSINLKHKTQLVNLPQEKNDQSTSEVLITKEIQKCNNRLPLKDENTVIYDEHELPKTKSEESTGNEWREAAEGEVNPWLTDEDEDVLPNEILKNEQVHKKMDANLLPPEDSVKNYIDSRICTYVVETDILEEKAANVNVGEINENHAVVPSLKDSNQYYERCSQKQSNNRFAFKEKEPLFLYAVEVSC